MDIRKKLKHPTGSWILNRLSLLIRKSIPQHIIQTPHPEYLAKGKTKDERLNNYRELFKAHIETELLTEIR
jgi:hypothetical protein